MAKKDKKLILVLNAVALAMGVVTIVVSYTGLPGTFDAEPLLGIGLACVGMVGLLNKK